MRGAGHLLAGPRVRAAGVGPQASGVVLARGALLDEQAARTVEHEHREGAVQRPAPVHGLLVPGPDRRAPLVAQHDLVAHRTPSRSGTRGREACAHFTVIVLVSQTSAWPG